ncbi:MAG TPA: glycosyltransferase, partial [Planctomycetota bacterium]|nr:glycosyltransferase [Planctomycetota bacterium]
MTTAEKVSVVIPVFNEAANIVPCLRALDQALRGLEHEILVCYDFDQDTTLPAIAAMPDPPAGLRLVKNTLGPGAAFALRAGMLAAEGDVVVTMMADLSDPPEVVPSMAREIRAGADVVSGSRYMKGGWQKGGPVLKRLLSQAAGRSLRWIAGLGTSDATTNFRAYRRDFLRSVSIESTAGFELALELTVKAHLAGGRVSEVPSGWTDRVAGESRFRLWKWLPRYLRWYVRAMGAPAFVGSVFLVLLTATAVVSWRHAPALPVLDEWVHVSRVVGDEPLTLEWLWSSHNDHRIPLPKLAGQGLARLAGMEGRWESLANVMLLGAAAAVLLAALRRWRGRLVWTDACVPMLLLNWAQWENLAWPFQIAFVGVVVLVALFLAVFLRRPGEAVGGRGILAGVILVLLPLCGAPGLPLAAALGAWWVAAGPGPRLVRGVAGAATLLLMGLYFVGYEKQPDLPPPPDAPLMMAVTAQALGAFLGHVGEATWPASAVPALAGPLLAAFLLAEAWRRRPAWRVPAGVLLAALAGLGGVAAAIAYGRGAGWPLAGFT